MSSRRTFLSTSLEAGGFAFAPGLLRQDTARPGVPFGVSSGDVTGARAIIWSRTDRPARMLVEWSTTESFQNVRRMRGPNTTEAAAFTARIDLAGLAPGQRIFYRVQFEDLSDSRNLSVPVTGSFLSAPREPRDVTFAWSADTVGQGWGINTEWGGMRIYETMRRARPDFFIHTGDTIYADSPVPPEIRLPDGKMWRNLVTPAKSKVAETLDEFRGNYTYNMLDEHVRRFNAEIPQLVLWDDHEVKNNWYPGMSLDADEQLHGKELARAGRQRATRISRALADSTVERGGAAHLSIVFLRSAPRRVRHRPADLPRPEHRESATVAKHRDDACGRPAACVVEAGAAIVARDVEGDRQRSAHRSCRSRRRHGVRRHCKCRGRRSARPRARGCRSSEFCETGANSQRRVGDGRRALRCRASLRPRARSFKDFDPFWEFVAGPLHAGTFGPSELDLTFGPEVRFSSVKAGSPGNRPPSDGLQFFGFTKISGGTRVMTVELRNLAGETIYTVDLEPEQ